MKIAFSDYDGTLSVPEEGVATETIASIHAWRDAGNKFGIVTGRDYSLIDKEARAYQIPVDFYICCNGAAIHETDGSVIYICCNGAAIHDTDGSVISSTPLSYDIMKAFFPSQHVLNYTDGMLFFTPEQAYTYRLRTDVPASFLTPLNSTEDAMNLLKPLQQSKKTFHSNSQEI